MQEKSLRSAELGDRFGFFYASHGKLRQMTVEDCTDFSSWEVSWCGRSSILLGDSVGVVLWSNEEEKPRTEISNPTIRWFWKKQLCGLFDQKRIHISYVESMPEPRVLLMLRCKNNDLLFRAPLEPFELHPAL